MQSHHEVKNGRKKPTARSTRSIAESSQAAAEGFEMFLNKKDNCEKVVLSA